MSDFPQAVRRARAAAAEGDARAVVTALTPHESALTDERHLPATLLLTWALNQMGQSMDAERLLAGVTQRSREAQLQLRLARAGLY